MGNLLASFITIIIPSVIDSVLLSFNVSSRFLQQIIALVTCLIILSLNSFRFLSPQSYVVRQLRFILLSLTTLIVQLIVLSTGGIYSPFLILIHFAIIGVSLIFQFRTALLFWVSAMVVLFLQAVALPDIVQNIQQDPTPILLYSVSFLLLIPLAQLLSYHYHIKDTLNIILQEQVNAGEQILSEVQELVFAIDKNAMILAVNPAVERLLHRSRSELLQQPLLDAVNLRDRAGRPMTRELILQQIAISQENASTMQDVSLLALPSMVTQQVTVTFHKMPTVKGSDEQWNVVMSGINIARASAEHEHQDLETARLQYEASLEGLKQQLKRDNQSANYGRLMLLTSAEQDILMAQSLKDHPIVLNNVVIDLASLCHGVLASQKDYADVFHVGLTFTNGEDTPQTPPQGSTTDNTTVGAKQFLSSCDVKLTSFVIQKLLQIAVLLSYGSENPKTAVTVGSYEAGICFVSIILSPTTILAKEQQDIFQQYYGQLRNKTNLRYGSGLEGYLAKLLLDQLRIPVGVDVAEANKTLTFLLFFKQAAV